jgi:hypothetical protein
VAQGLLFAVFTPEMADTVGQEPLQRVGDGALSGGVLAKDGKASALVRKIER